MKNMQEHSLDFALNAQWQNYIYRLDDDVKKLFESLELIGQIHILNQIEFSQENAEAFTKDLSEIDRFFSSIGGLLGYQKAIHEILFPKPFSKKVLQAPYIKIDEMTPQHAEAIHHFIMNIPQMAEVYAIGGAADRLNLTNGQKLLPAACLKIAGKTLLEYLIADVQAKEWLYFKFTKKVVLLPIVMMTSFEKDNQAHIFDILHKHKFFNREKNKFLIFHQPLVPMVDQHMNWQTTEGKGLFLKPGGHGAIWNLCLKEGVFDKLIEFGIKKLFIRQINNPIACIDFGNMAFLGYGLQKNAKFGFFACERFAGSQEGIDVLLEDAKGRFSLTNIEYCQLEDAGINDQPSHNGFSLYPANTNVLFADVVSLKELTKAHPLPGKILNFKTFHLDGQVKSLARLETMMQNMADYIVESSPDMQNVFMSLSPRLKTISPVKKQKTLGSTYTETPQACFFDFMQNASELLHDCQISHEPIRTLEEFYQFPSFIFSYLPALGPIYEIIRQKVTKGSLSKGAYLSLQIPELSLEDFSLKGALVINAEHPYGKNGIKEQCPRVKLNNCRINNKGVDYLNTSAIYQDIPLFLEKCEIYLEGFSEFEAVNINFEGNLLFKVPDGFKMIVYSTQDGAMKTELVPLEQPSWSYQYIYEKAAFKVVKSSSN